MAWKVGDVPLAVQVDATCAWYVMLLTVVPDQLGDVQAPLAAKVPTGLPQRYVP